MSVFGFKDRPSLVLINEGEYRKVVGREFPFLHVVSVVIIPFAYWVACIEIGVYNSNENEFTLSFGQVSTPQS